MLHYFVKDKTSKTTINFNNVIIFTIFSIFLVLFLDPIASLLKIQDAYHSSTCDKAVYYEDISGGYHI